MNVFKLLDESSIVLRYEVAEYKTWHVGRYIKMEIELIDHSALFVREYLDENERRYSYHWQDQVDQLRCRWDNAPHYPQLITFPFHCHKGDLIEPAREIDLEDVLARIEKILNQSC